MRLLKLNNVSGIKVSKELVERSMEARALNIPMKSGILPWKWLSSKFRCMRPVRFDNQTGMVELIRLEERSSELRDVKLTTLTEGILTSHDAKFSVSKEGSMLIGWNQSICSRDIYDKSKCLNDRREDTHPKSSMTGLGAPISYPYEILRSRSSMRGP
ncbi:hypothetical protein HanIR_Chr09g0398541 [Helianthus annuus]|nr:hypothetical protein HanIR_Chr09g0398541 [Helianthus annuus]